MIKHVLVTAAALALLLATGSAHAGSKLGIQPDRTGAGQAAGGKIGGGTDKGGARGKGAQLNRMPASGLTIETVELPDGGAVQLAEVRGAGLIRTTGGRYGSGVQTDTSGATRPKGK